MRLVLVAVAVAPGNAWNGMTNEPFACFEIARCTPSKRCDEPMPQTVEPQFRSLDPELEPCAGRAPSAGGWKMPKSYGSAPWLRPPDRSA